MIIPSDKECRRICKLLDGDSGLTEWQQEFVESNIDRVRFTDRQKEIVAELAERFET